MDSKFINEKLDEVIKTLSELKNSLQQVVSLRENKFDSLKQLLLSDKWPEAVNSALICDPNSEEDKKERGIGIVELVVDQSLTENQKFLDYGCGEGHCVNAAVEALGCGLAVGFDIKPSNWTNTEKIKFTSSYDEVMSLGPYDAILIFDVLDHVENETPIDLLKKAKDLLATNGKIYLRTHPWISRHGTHLYHKINKAYAHLVFTVDELSQIIENFQDEVNQKIVYPIKTYEDYFDSVNLKIADKQEIKEHVDTFFQQPDILERILTNTGHATFPEFQMSLSFIDYKLENI